MLLRARGLWIGGGLLLTACNVEPPGELIGEYAVRGMLLENTCGSEALPAMDPLDFQVQIRDDGLQALWLLTPPARPGTLEDDGDFEFETESSFVVDPEGARQPPDPFVVDPEAFVDEARLEQAFDPAAQPGASRCTLQIVERMRGTLTRDLAGPIDGGDADDGDSSPDAEAPSFDLSGDNEIEIRAAAGSDCELVMQDAGGPFEALPCFARYAIEGDLIDAQQ